MQAHLVVAEGDLAALVRTRPPSATADGPPLLHWAPATRQPQSHQQNWLAGPVRPLPAATQGRPLLAGEPADATLLVWAAPDTAGTRASWPDQPAVLDGWLRRHAPGWPLLCAGQARHLLVLLLRADGTAWGAWRALQGGAPWQVLDSVQLPGNRMLHVPLVPTAAPAGPSAWHDDPEDPSEAPADRYSRLRGALGADTLRRLQGLVFALVGAGRTGSVLAHTLVRMGARVLLLDPDQVELHNLDGDVLPQHEGLAKTDAVARTLRPLLRPGAWMDPRRLDIAAPVSGLLLARADVVLSCVDDDRARLWVAAWCAALLKPLLDIGVSVQAAGVAGVGGLVGGLSGGRQLGADLRLTLPGHEAGAACLACLGGFTDPLRLPTGEAGDQVLSQGDFRQQRAGSLRSWSVASAHLGLRLLEGLVAGMRPGSLFRQLTEDASGRLTVRDQLPVAGARQRCPVCSRFTARGRAAVTAAAVHDAARALRAAAGR